MEFDALPEVETTDEVPTESCGSCAFCDNFITHDERVLGVSFTFNCHGDRVLDTQSYEGEDVDDGVELYHPRCLVEKMQSEGLVRQ